MINETLLKIQQELKAPKGQYNSFGKYKYRSCEDILEAVKPILAKYGATLTIADSLEFVGDRYYIKATATISAGEETIQTTAYAREEETKKGMDGSQITGTASSYARKYCLNGLFLIDDTKDADTDEYKKQTSDDDFFAKPKETKKETKQVDIETFKNKYKAMLINCEQPVIDCLEHNSLPSMKKALVEYAKANKEVLFDAQKEQIKNVVADIDANK